MRRTPIRSVTSDPGGFNFKALQSNVVFRWEYEPGSTLFAVWNHGRQGFDSHRGHEEFPGRRARSLPPAPGEHVPREAVVLAQPVMWRDAGRGDEGMRNCLRVRVNGVSVQAG